MGLRLPFKATAVLLLVLPLEVLAQPAQTGPAVVQGETYASARESLVKGGYKPVSHEGSGRCSAFAAICAAFPEAAACAAGDTGTCRFEWTRAGAAGATFIETRGEAPERLVVIRSYEAGAGGSAYPLGTMN